MHQSGFSVTSFVFLTTDVCRMYMYDSLCNLYLCEATELLDGLVHVLKDKRLASVGMLDNELYIWMQLKSCCR